MRIGNWRIENWSDDCSENVFLDDLSIYKVLLNNALQHRRSAGVVPNPFGIHYGDWALLAYPQAVRFCPVHTVFRFRQPQFLQALLEVVP